MTRTSRVTGAAQHDAFTALERAVCERVDNGYSRGIVAGLLLPDGRTQIVAHGDTGTGRCLGAADVFEIGSITKAFTGTLLAQMAQHGEVALDDPVQRFLPAGVRMPAEGGREITLQDLATHTSGLPCLPANLAALDEDDPYADYTVEQLYDFLSSHTLTRAVGAQFDYSNVGAGLLGHVLALRTGQAYDELLRQRILAPLAMTDTAVEVTPQMRRRFVAGHDAEGDLVGYWNLGTLAGAGALRSTAADLLAFAAAGLDDADSDVGRAIRTAQRPRRRVEPEMSIGLSWLTDLQLGHEIVWHSGGTGGFASFLGIDRTRRTAVVVLGNSASSLDDIGMLALDERMEPATVHRPVTLTAAALQRFVGIYDGPDGEVTLIGSGGGLAAQQPGQPPLRLTPIGETTFVIRAAPGAVVTFACDPRGGVTGAALAVGETEVRFERIPKALRDGGGQ